MYAKEKDKRDANIRAKNPKNPQASKLNLKATSAEDANFPMRNPVPSDVSATTGSKGRIDSDMPSKSASVATRLQIEITGEGSRGAAGSVKAGSIIAVYWPLDKKYYDAEVKTKKEGKFLLEYIADGEVEWIDLDAHDYFVKSH